MNIDLATLDLFTPEENARSAAIDAHYAALELGVPAELLVTIGPSLEAA